MIRIEKTKNDQDFAAAMELVRRVFLQLTIMRSPGYVRSWISSKINPQAICSILIVRTMRHN
jgi:hypothetical protein